MSDNKCNGENFNITGEMRSPKVDLLFSIGLLASSQHGGDVCRKN